MPGVDPGHLRLAEALLFASAEPVGAAALARHLPEGADIGATLGALQALYAGRGVELVAMGERWQFRTAPDLAPVLARTIEQPRKLSRAAVETLAVIAYHQPVTRAEIEEIRGVAVGQGTIDILFEAGFIRPRGRRQTPGKPVTWGTSEQFLTHFGLGSLNDLPNLAELKAAGLLDKRPAVTAYAERAGLLPRSEEREAALAAAPPGEAAEAAAEAEQFQPLASEDGNGAGKPSADAAKGGM
ncbi:MAG: SMC-Scp complex subunit ScpB [Alphaproteobacteria bacterium]|nr:SMC-Scp complex subunit ScpB [Alphaproteobacteria bacterium]